MPRAFRRSTPPRDSCAGRTVATRSAFNRFNFFDSRRMLKTLYSRAAPPRVLWRAAGDVSTRGAPRRAPRRLLCGVESWAGVTCLSGKKVPGWQHMAGWLAAAHSSILSPAKQKDSAQTHGSCSCAHMCCWLAAWRLEKEGRKERHKDSTFL